MRGRPPLRRVIALALCFPFAGIAGLGCGGSSAPTAIEPGSLAAAVPESASVYGEFVVRPAEDGDSSAADLVARFLADDERAEDQRLEFIDGVAQELPLAESPSYEDSIEPWLGERAAFFADLEGASSQDEIAGGWVFAVTDEEAARDGVSDLLEGEAEPREEDGAWTVSSGVTTAVIADETLLIADGAAVAESPLASDGAGLEESDWFRTLLEQVESDSLGFVGIPVEQAISAAAIADPSAAIGPELTEATIDGLGLQAGDPAVAEFGTDAEDLWLEISYPTDRAEVGDARRLIEAAPADSALAFGDPFFAGLQLASFTTGVEFGLRRQAERTSPAKVQRNLLANLGYDPVASLEPFSGAIAYQAGENRDGSAAVVRFGLDPRRSEPGVFPVDGLRFVLGTSLPSTEISEPSALPIPVGPYSFSARLPGASDPVEIGALRSEVIAALPLGRKSELGGALAPEETIGESGALDDVESELGSDWTGVGFADLDRLSDLGSLIDPRLAFVDIPSARVIAGARERRDGVDLRFQLTEFE